MAETPARRLAKQLIPAVIAGVGSAAVLVLMDLIAENWLHHLIWDKLPASLGFTTGSRWWIFFVLTFAGVAVGLVVWLMPGHAGPDPATLGLMHAPSPLITVPSLLLAAIIGLACGVSLGPEFPILGANATLAVAFGARFLPQAGPAAWAGLASAGTLGALFGTPIAAALMLTETLATHKARKASGTGSSPRWRRQPPAASPPSRFPVAAPAFPCRFRHFPVSGLSISSARQ